MYMHVYMYLPEVVGTRSDNRREPSNAERPEKLADVLTILVDVAEDIEEHTELLVRCTLVERLNEDSIVGLHRERDRIIVDKDTTSQIHPGHDVEILQILPRAHVVDDDDR